jgi:hypothetical protein
MCPPRRDLGLLTKLQGPRADGEADGQENNDSEVADNSAQPSDEEGDDDGDDNDNDNEEGDEGDQDQDDGSQNDADDQGSPTPDRGKGLDPSRLDETIPKIEESRDMGMTDASVLPQNSAVLGTEAGDLSPMDEPGLSGRRHFQPANPLNLAPPHAQLQMLASPRQEGSPLKNVIMLSPTEPSPNMSPMVGSFHSGPVVDEAEEVSMEVDPSGDGYMEDAYETQGVAESMDDADPGSFDEADGQELEITQSLNLPTAQEIEEALQEPAAIAQPDPASAVNDASQAHFSHPDLRDLPEVDDSVPLEVAEETFLEDTAVPERADDDPGATAGDDDGSLDLLGGLEQELDRQAEFNMDKAPAVEAAAEDASHAAGPATDHSEDIATADESQKEADAIEDASKV